MTASSTHLVRFSSLVLALVLNLPAGAVRLQAAQQGAVPKIGGRTPLEWSERMAYSEIKRSEPNHTYGGTQRYRWDYTNGLLALAQLKLGDRLDDARLREFGENYISGLVRPDGTIDTYSLEEYNIDMITPGKVALLMLERGRGDREKLLGAVRLLRRQLAEHPRTSEGGFWHKLRYPWQMWLDGLYMGAPFYAHYAKMFNEPESFDDVTRQFIFMDQHAWNPEKELHYHGWDERRQQPWANKETGLSQNFWGRAIGWYSMAIVDTLDFIPANHPNRPKLLEILQRVAGGIARWQDAKSGLWWQVMDQGTREGNYLEATASCMFVYTLTKAINQGYLPRERYEPVLRRGYEGIIRDLIRVDPDGTVNLLQCCEVSGLGGQSRGRDRDGTFEYYIFERVIENDLKGVGPFILAGIELDRLYGGTTTTSRSSTTFTQSGGNAVFASAAATSSATYSTVSSSSSSASASASTSGTVSWETTVPEILARIKPPTFPARDFKITDYGAVANDDNDDSAAITQAIAACANAGGGRVVIEGGTFLTGAVHLKSNVNLHVAEGATLKFLTDPTKYPTVFTRWEGMECMNYSPLIYAFEQENIAITGTGTLEGDSSNDNWWGWSPRGGPRPTKQVASRNALFAQAEQGVPVEQRVFGPGHFLRPNFIQPYRCRNVLIEGVTVRNSPMWHLHPVLCTNVTIRNVTVIGHGPNNDGCNPESSRDVLIEGCYFDTGDDCIAIKSGRNNDGRRVGVASENLIIRNCTMKDGHGGVVMGSEISGHCRNVFVENCTMDSPNLDRALRFKNNAVRGGVIENVFMRNVTVGRVAEAVLTIDLLYEEGANGPYQPIVRNVALENVTSSASPRVMWVVGFPGAVVDDIRFVNCTFSGIQAAERLGYASRVTFENVTIEPATRGRSANSVPTPAPASAPAAP